jgi:amino acid permease
VLLEIQDTIRQPPKAVKTMTKSVYVAITSAFALYFSTAVTCYSALGNTVPGEVLQGFDGEWAAVGLSCLVCQG